MMITWGGIARLLRRRVVLGLIFGLSLTYCAISLFAHEKIGSSIANYGEDENNDAMIDNDDLIVDPDPEDDIRDKHIPWPPPASDDGGLDPNNDFNSGVVERNCRNSIQGKALIVDERGLVCARKEVLPGGCCREDAEKTDRYSCETCNPEGCCAVYEYCVSCCLHPGKRRSKKDAQSGPAVRRDGEKSRRTEDAVKLHFRNLDRFQICLAVCRTSSASVRHENTYKDPNSKHCYINSPGHQRVQRDLISVNNNGDNIAITSSTVRLFILNSLFLKFLITSPFILKLDIVTLGKQRVLTAYKCLYTALIGTYAPFFLKQQHNHLSSASSLSEKITIISLI